MKHGFSLVELSIVLVILGLLTGGILAGQSLIRAAELRAIPTEFSRWVTATHSFRSKYNALPGDMTNATAFWGTAAVPASCATTASTSTETCNGDGDGQVERTTNVTGGTSNEMFRYWQHLASAGLIEGTYNGIAVGTNDVSAIIGTNVPGTRISSAGWTMRWLGPHAGDTMNFALDYGNYFIFGAGTTNGTTNGNILKPEELWSLDTKIDDGKPAYGKVVAKNWDNCTDADDQNDLDSVYILTEPGSVCSPFFVRVF